MAIRFDLSPLDLWFRGGRGTLSREEIQRSEGTYFLIDVWDRRIDLFAIVVDGDGNSWVNSVDRSVFDISEADLMEAVVRAGGCPTESGSYPISKEIEEKIRAREHACIWIEDPRGPRDEADFQSVTMRLFMMPAKRPPRRPSAKGKLSISRRA